jgi:hypothetical protein
MADILILNRCNICPFLYVQIHPWVNFESLLQKCLVGQLVRSNRSTGPLPALSKTTTFIGKLFPRRGAGHCGMCAGSLCSITMWSWALLERPPIVRQLNIFPAFYGTRRFNTEFTRALHLFLSWARPIQSTSPHPTSPRSILILFTHLHLQLPTTLFQLALPHSCYFTSEKHCGLQYVESRWAQPLLSHVLIIATQMKTVSLSPRRGMSDLGVRQWHSTVGISCWFQIARRRQCHWTGASSWVQWMWSSSHEEVPPELEWCCCQTKGTLPSP